MASKKQVTNFLKKKSDEFLKLFENDEQLHYSIKFKFFIAGGSIASLIMDEEPNDYDIYFKDLESMRRATEYLKSSRPDVIVFNGANAITLTERFQIITRYTGTPDEVICKFDFSHCRCYFYSYSGQPLSIYKDAMESIATKHLIYNSCPNPIGALYRLKKFFYRGWDITKDNWFKIIMDVNAIDLTKPTIVKEQISFMGNGSSAFMNNLDICEKVSSEDIYKALEESDYSLPKLKPNQESDNIKTGY